MVYDSVVPYQLYLVTATYILLQINLTGASDLVRSTLNRKALSIFAKYRDEVQVSLKESVIPLLNSYLADISPDQLLEIIYGLRRKRPDSAAN